MLDAKEHLALLVRRQAVGCVNKRLGALHERLELLRHAAVIFALAILALVVLAHDGQGSVLRVCLYAAACYAPEAALFSSFLFFTYLWSMK